jgi:hypothetical protein
VQLKHIVACALLLGPAAALAEDRVDTTVTWFQERRPDSQSLTVLHPQFDFGIDLGSHFGFSAGYSADIVTGATPAIYAAPRRGETVDTISTASQFSDTRHSGRGALTFTGNRSTLTAGYSYGQERDYRSHTISVSGSVDMPGKNTTLTLSYSRNIDQVCDFDNGDASPLERRPLSGQNPCFTSEMSAGTITHDLAIDSVQASLLQNLTPVLVMQLGVYGQVVDGFQSNPYRRVRVFDVDAQESTPLSRARGAAFLRFNLAFPAITSAASLSVRGYSDTWGVSSATADLMYHQYLGKSILFRLRGRIYQQSGAIFFRDAVDYQVVGPVGAYFTGDRDLAPLRSYLAGGKLSWISTAQEGRPIWGFLDEVDFHLGAEALWTIPLTDTPPGGDVTGTVPDAIVATVGLLLRY